MNINGGRLAIYRDGIKVTRDQTGMVHDEKHIAGIFGGEGGILPVCGTFFVNAVYHVRT